MSSDSQRRYILKRCIEQPNGCWEWKLSKDQDGYGTANWSCREYRAHRFSYCVFNLIDVDSIKGYMVCHTCDNPSCVSPKHLYVGTATDNNRDTVKRSRHVNHKQKLTKEQVLEIRAVYGKIGLNGMTRVKLGLPTTKQLSKKYGVTPESIYNIVSGATFKEV